MQRNTAIKKLLPAFTDWAGENKGQLFTNMIKSN